MNRAPKLETSRRTESRKGMGASLIDQVARNNARPLSDPSATRVWRSPTLELKATPLDLSRNSSGDPTHIPIDLRKNRCNAENAGRSNIRYLPRNPRLWNSLHMLPYPPPNSRTHAKSSTRQRVCSSTLARL